MTTEAPSLTGTLEWNGETYHYRYAPETGTLLAVHPEPAPETEAAIRAAIPPPPSHEPEPVGILPVDPSTYKSELHPIAIFILVFSLAGGIAFAFLAKGCLDFGFRLLDNIPPATQSR